MGSVWQLSCGLADRGEQRVAGTVMRCEVKRTRRPASQRWLSTLEFNHFDYKSLESRSASDCTARLGIISSLHARWKPEAVGVVMTRPVLERRLPTDHLVVAIDLTLYS